MILKPNPQPTPTPMIIEYWALDERVAVERGITQLDTRQLARRAHSAGADTVYILQPNTVKWRYEVVGSHVEFIECIH